MKTWKRILGFIVCSAVVFAASFAVACGQSEESPAHKHGIIRVAGVAATCTEAGSKQHYKCNECGKLFSDGLATAEITAADTAIEALGHSLEHHEAQAAGAVSSGGTKEYWECTRCGKYFSDGAASAEISGENLIVFAKFSLNDGRITAPNNTGRLFSSTAVGGETEPISEQKFALRFFIGIEGKMSDLPESAKVRVNLNIEREGALWQLLFVYGKSEGASVNIGGSSVALDAGLTKEVEENGGLYLVFVRNGASVSVYAESTAGELTALKENVAGFSTNAITKIGIGVNDGFWADETHPAVIKDGRMIIGTTDKNAFAGEKE